MASTTSTNSNKDIVAEIPGYIQIFNDDSVERSLQSPFAPPMLDDPLTGISSKDVVISHNPTISARIYLPKLSNEKVPILVYFHGGRFFLGSSFSRLFHHYFNNFVPQADAIVVSVEYRLAPENPLPACYHDCWAALQWVCSHDSIENRISNTEPWLIQHGDFDRVFIGGDSAGGNIAHNIAMRVGKEALPGDVKVLGAILCHPFFYSSYPIGSKKSVDVVPKEQNHHRLVWKLVYPSAPGGIDNPMVNPVGPGAPGLDQLGCSRMIVCVAGSKDELRDRGFWYCECVKQSGWQGKLELFEEEEEGHVYHVFHPESDNAHKLFKRLASFLHQ